MALEAVGLCADTNLITVAPSPVAPMVYAGANARIRAQWQERLTLGPGDVLNICLFDHGETERPDVTVGPDGRVTYLQAQSVMAEGKTIDELRSELDRALAAYYRHARVTVLPVSIRSKKFTILGKVSQNGVYHLDRPLTILEGVATAGGLETGVAQGANIELADLPRSFLIRQGKRVPVDFERLLNQGDLSQNFFLEPGDFVFFPSVISEEVYVLGAVSRQGEQGIAGGMTVMGALTKAGGFQPNAYKQRVLLVRGSINSPQRMIIDASAILAGTTKDIPLQPKDVIYVADHPWSRVEDLADLAATAFLQAMTVSWTGYNIGNVVDRPILPSVK